MWQSCWKIEIPLIKVGLLQGKQKTIFFFKKKKKKSQRLSFKLKIKAKTDPTQNVNLGGQ